MRLLVALSLLASVVAFAPAAEAHPVHTDCGGLEIWVVPYVQNRDPNGGIVCIGADRTIRENLEHSGELSPVTCLVWPC